MIFFLIFLITITLKFTEGNYQFLSTVMGEVEKENYTYYNMTYTGNILLELTSTSGDCDLYVSQNTIKPTYEPQNNCLQSVTCGVDTVIIPRSFKRPLGIGIFGHPSHDVSQYILTFFRLDNPEDIFSKQYGEDLLRPQSKNSAEVPDSENNREEEKEESVYWRLLGSLMEQLIDFFFFLLT